MNASFRSGGASRLARRDRRARLAVTGASGLALALALVAAACGPKKDASAPDAARGGAAGAGGAGPVASAASPVSANAEEAKMNAAALGNYRRGLELWRAGDLTGAKKAFRDATAADPQAYQAFHSLGVVQERTGEQDAALNSYRQANAVSPNYEPAIAAYGLLLARKGNVTEADDFLTDKKARMPRGALVLAALAEIKSLKRDTGSAQQFAQDALKINPDCRPAMVTLARDHYRNRRLDLSLYALKAILDGEGANNPARDKDNAEAHLLRAVILKELNRRAPAIEEFQKAVALRPDLVEARVQLAAYLLESGNARRTSKPPYATTRTTCSPT
ncbi:MAG: tetratricopeptide repeat protein [Polyangiaceae bacterium]|nr:tetratricopeptide repeat protein [Polyangiaceae bacterium]